MKKSIKFLGVLISIIGASHAAAHDGREGVRADAAVSPHIPN